MQDEEVYREILTLFKEKCKVKMEELEGAYALPDYAKYRLYSHGLKTTALTVGAVVILHSFDYLLKGNRPYGRCSSTFRVCGETNRGGS